MWKAICQLFESSPFTIILEGNYNELKRRLDHDNLSPDFNEHKRSLLTTALHSRQVSIAVLLLQHKANPNFNPVKPESKRSQVFSVAYDISPSLAKLMLTYGASWDYLKPYYIDQTSPHVDFLRKVETDCYSLYKLLQDAETCCQEKRYEEAYKKFSDAKKQLDAFGEEEQKMLAAKDEFYKSYTACRNDYFYRSNLCQDKMSQCLKALKIDSTKETKRPERQRTVSESIPLLSSRDDVQWDDREIRGRIYSKSAPASTSSLSSASAQLATNLNSLLCSSSPITLKTRTTQTQDQKEVSVNQPTVTSTAQMHFKHA